jgi:hypothetical protein
MAQASGARGVGVYCVPQAVQMNASMMIRSLPMRRTHVLATRSLHTSYRFDLTD